MAAPELLWAGNQPVCPDSAGVPVRVEGESWNGRYVKVRGLWDGASIDAREITEEPGPPARSLPAAPCAAPAEGWPGMPSGDNGEALDQALEQEVRSLPALYLGTWAGAVRPGSGATDVLARVVGTVGSVDSATEALSRIYPFNLCVVRAEFSANDLNSVMSVLSSLDFSWRLRIDPVSARVVVSTHALEPSMADALAPYADRVVVRSLVEKDE